MRRQTRFPLVALLASLGVARSMASCAESSVTAEPRPDAGEVEAGVPIPASDAGGCMPGAWCRVDLPPSPVSLNGIWGSGSDDVWIVGTPALTLHWNGNRLAASKVDTRQALFGVWGSGKDDVWTFSTSASTWHTRGFDGYDAGWTRSAEGAGPQQGGWPTPIYGMWGTGATDVWAVGASLSSSNARPTVFHSNGWQDGGPLWQPSGTSNADPPGPEPVTFNAISGSVDSRVWIVGNGGKTRHTTGWDDERTVWTPVNSETSRDLFAVWCSPDGVVWAGGEGGTMSRLTREQNGEYSAQTVAVPTTVPIRAIWGSAADDVWAVGGSGTILHWNGKEWRLAEEPLRSATTEPLYAVWGATSSDLWIAGRNVLLHLGTTSPSGKPL